MVWVWEWFEGKGESLFAKVVRPYTYELGLYWWSVDFSAGHSKVIN